MKILIVVSAATLLVGFGSGFLAGRAFPAHHYQRFGETQYLLDSSTGRVCDPLKVVMANPLDQALTDKAPNVPSCVVH
jgi:hypothetical protein